MAPKYEIIWNFKNSIEERNTFSWKLNGGGGGRGADTSRFNNAHHFLKLLIQGILWITNLECNKTVLNFQL
jgi:hypothetical protein